jgi:dTDP-4-amino-4,6-dideoxygalactose transaminase
MSKLALLGGKPVWKGPFPPYITIGSEEKKAVLRVMDRGILSDFVGSNCPEFYGGPEVQSFEKEWARYFGARYAVSMNSATSCLYSAVGAIGISPGDEVITTPYTMSATASAILVYQGLPVFADIDPGTFTLDPRSVATRITPRTKAIIVTHLFGHPADMEGILAVARRHRLRVIEDAAQSPGALYHGRQSGTLSDIGVFSLNCHKVIQTGEGGLCTTDDPDYRLRLQLIRNHGEAVVGEGLKVKSLVNLLGWNYRLTEPLAAIGREQLKRLKGFNRRRWQLADRLSARLRQLPGLNPPLVRPRCTHAYYVYAVNVDPRAFRGISRDLLARALQAEGIPCSAGYLKPLYMLPVYQKKILFGKNGYPLRSARHPFAYRKGLCPVTEEVEGRLINLHMIHDPLGPKDIDRIADAFEKVTGNLDALRRLRPTHAS